MKSAKIMHKFMFAKIQKKYALTVYITSIEIELS